MTRPDVSTTRQKSVPSAPMRDRRASYPVIVVVTRFLPCHRCPSRVAFQVTPPRPSLSEHHRASWWCGASRSSSTSTRSRQTAAPPELLVLALDHSLQSTRSTVQRGRAHSTLVDQWPCRCFLNTSPTSITHFRHEPLVLPFQQTRDPLCVRDMTAREHRDKR